MLLETIVRRDYSEFIRWGKSGFLGSPHLEDSTHSRLVDVARCLHRECGLGGTHVHAEPIEFAVILRQIVRRFKDGLKTDVVVKLPSGVDQSVLDRVGITTLPVSGGFQSLNAIPWKPKWLEANEETLSVDEASLSPLDVNARARFLLEESAIGADAIFLDATGNHFYRSPGQLAATRSALSISPGSTLIVQLPTGGGKTDVAITVLKSEMLSTKTNVLIVPTVALALDLERRFRNVIGSRWGYEDALSEMTLVWTGDTPPEVRETIKNNIATGDQPILITSPETLAIDNGVGAALEIAASNGRVGWMIVDEAHIIKQWGQDFRPDFLDIAPLREKLKRCALENGHEPLRTLLLSATYTSDTLEYLVEKFGGSDPVHLCAANEIRSEIDIWTDVSENSAERQKKFIEALHHLPRPLIVYATKPDHAKQWVELLKSEGFTRSSTFSGKTVGKDRKDILQKFRNDLGEASEYDVVVATSAFGLGVDYDQVRAVVHVCLPETVDRWYQEIGRGGRDGYKSAAVTISCKSDLSDAQGLGVSVLNPETAWKRYQSILSNLGIGSKDDPSLRYFNLHETPEEVEQGSYNRRWNKQTLRGLIDLKILEQRITWWRDIPAEDREKLDQIHEDDEIRAEIMRLKILKNLKESEFLEIWEDWKAHELGLQDVSLGSFLETLGRNSSICELLESVYTDSLQTSTRFGQMAKLLRLDSPCGRCPDCRRHDFDAPSSKAPTPINSLHSYKSLEKRSSESELIEKITSKNQLLVTCSNGEISVCIDLIKSHLECHVVDIREDKTEYFNVIWQDLDMNFLMCSPILPTIIIHGGNLSRDARDVIARRIYLDNNHPFFVVGPTLSTVSLPGFYQVSYDTLKMWMN
jgi:ATP-dependent DNA helicase RecQ